MNSSGIRESIQVQTAQAHRGLGFKDCCHRFCTVPVEKAVPFQAATTVQIGTPALRATAALPFDAIRRLQHWELELAGSWRYFNNCPGSLCKIDHFPLCWLPHHHVMKARKPTLKQVQTVPCPTCGAPPGERCELGTGLPRR